MDVTRQRPKRSKEAFLLYRTHPGRTYTSLRLSTHHSRPPIESFIEHRTTPKTVLPSAALDSFSAWRLQQGNEWFTRCYVGCRALFCEVECKRMPIHGASTFLRQARPVASLFTGQTNERTEVCCQRLINLLRLPLMLCNCWHSVPTSRPWQPYGGPIQGSLQFAATTIGPLPQHQL